MRNYTAGERAIIILGIATGKTCSEINEILIKDQRRSGASIRRLPEGSYNMMQERYLSELGVPKEIPEWLGRIFEHSNNPKSIGGLCTFTISEPNLYDNIDKLQIQHYSKENVYAKTTALQSGCEGENPRGSEYSC